MKVILRADIDKLGSMGDVVVVKNGYARNFLIPQGIAYFATDGAANKIEQEKKRYMIKMVQEKKYAEELSQKFADMQVTIAMKVGDEGKLFGSVTTQMISSELSLHGYKIDKKDIAITDQIKSLGVFTVKVKLHSEVSASLRVWVISEE